MKCLIVIDVEKEWFIEDGENYVGHKNKELDNINRLIDYFRSHGNKIIFVRHVEGSGEEFVGDRAELIDSLHREKGDEVIVKNRVSCFYETDLMDSLKGTEYLVICGMLTNLCVRSAVSDAYDRDFDLTLVNDACIALDEETHEFTLKDLKETRPDIEIMTTKEFISQG